jgi:hypothetical protein
MYSINLIQIHVCTNRPKDFGCLNRQSWGKHVISWTNISLYLCHVYPHSFPLLPINAGNSTKSVKTVRVLKLRFKNTEQSIFLREALVMDSVE